VQFYVFSIINAKSFESVANWHDEFLVQASPRDPETFPFIVLGLQSDFADKREVSRQKVETWMASQGGNMKYLEASSKDPIGVNDVFELAVSMVEEGEASKNAEIVYQVLDAEQPLITPPEEEDPALRELKAVFAPLLDVVQQLEAETHFQEKFKAFIDQATTELQPGWHEFERASRDAIQAAIDTMVKVAEEPAVKEGIDALEAWGKQTEEQIEEAIRATGISRSRTEYEMIN